jgi:threonine synthase
VHAATGIVIDPHTAVAAKVAREHVKDGVPMLVLETAQPAKFADTIRAALDIEVSMPKGYEDLLERPQQFTALAAETDAVKHFIVEHA